MSKSIYYHVLKNVTTTLEDNSVFFNRFFNFIDLIKLFTLYESRDMFLLNSCILSKYMFFFSFMLVIILPLNMWNQFNVLKCNLLPLYFQLRTYYLLFLKLIKISFNCLYACLFITKCF